MGMQINTNVAALNSYRNLSNTQNDLSKSLEKLSSGLRINRAADDAAGLAISEGLRSQVSGLKVAARNAQDGISVIQTAEGGLTETHSILQRLRDLAVQAGNDSNNVDSRSAITTEATALVKELGRISETTNFNGISLLKGDVSTDTGVQSQLSFQVGANGGANDQIKVDFSGANVAAIASSLTVGGAAASFDVATPTAVGGVQAFSITNPDTSVSAVSVTLGGTGSYKTVQEVADALNASTNFNGLAKASVDKDNKLVVTANSGGAVVGTGAAAVAGTGVSAATAITAGALNFSTATGAASALTTLDQKITGISTARASLGAQQNRFESAINSLNVSGENLAAAESRIRDTDMASEMVNYTRANILSQAGTAMLAQANQSNQGVLQLLG